MALGDIKQGHAVVAGGQSLQIKPGNAGEAWRVRGVYFTQEAAGEVKLVRTDGVNEIELEANAADVNGYVGGAWVVTQDTWLELKNTTGESRVFGYDAIEIHVATS